MKNDRKKTTKPSAGRRIIASIHEAIEWAEGDSSKARITEVRVPVIDVRAVRKRLGLSQAAFANRFGFPTATVRNWEQGRTRPDGPARVLLAVIERHPEAVEDVLQRAS